MSGFTGTNAMRTARAKHTCEECDRDIWIGERYHLVTFVHDGAWHTQKSCRQCHSLQADLFVIDIRGVDEYGDDTTYASLHYDVDWNDLTQRSPLWARRVDGYRKQWAGIPYPQEEPPEENH